MKKETPLIFIVDDDPDVLEALGLLFESADYDFETFASADEFLLRKPCHRACCLVLDMRMPGLSGLELQDELIKRELVVPIVFITGHGGVPETVSAMKKGAVDFLPKPFVDEELLNAVDRAIEESSRIRKKKSQEDNVQCLLKTLTPREYEIMRCVIAGMLNKQVAYKLRISERTVKFHRGNIMGKMQVVSVADLVRLTQKADILPIKI
jgi:FixJ family two-component response regulator